MNAVGKLLGDPAKAGGRDQDRKRNCPATLAVGLFGVDVLATVPYTGEAATVSVTFAFPFLCWSFNAFVDYLGFCRLRRLIG